MIAPKGLPAPVSGKLSAALQQALASDNLKEKINAQRLETLSSSSTELQAILDRDHERWGAIIRQADIKLQ